MIPGQVDGTEEGLNNVPASRYILYTGPQGQFLHHLGLIIRVSSQHLRRVAVRQGRTKTFCGRVKQVAGFNLKATSWFGRFRLEVKVLGSRSYCDDV